MAEGAQGGLGRPRMEGTNESFHWRRANRTVRLLSACAPRPTSRSRALVTQLGALLSGVGWGSEAAGAAGAAGAGFECHDSLCSEEGRTDLYFVFSDQEVSQGNT